MEFNKSHLITQQIVGVLNDFIKRLVEFKHYQKFLFEELDNKFLTKEELVEMTNKFFQEFNDITKTKFSRFSVASDIAEKVDSYSSVFVFNVKYYQERGDKNPEFKLEYENAIQRKISDVNTNLTKEIEEIVNDFKNLCYVYKKDLNQNNKAEELKEIERAIKNIKEYYNNSLTIDKTLNGIEIDTLVRKTIERFIKDYPCRIDEEQGAITLSQCKIFSLSKVFDEFIFKIFKDSNETPTLESFRTIFREMLSILSLEKEEIQK